MTRDIQETINGEQRLTVDPEQQYWDEEETCLVGDQLRY